MLRGNADRNRRPNCGRSRSSLESGCPDCGAPLPRKEFGPIELNDLDEKGPQTEPDEYDLDCFDAPEPPLDVGGTFWADVEPDVGKSTLDSAKLEELADRIGRDVANNAPIVEPSAEAAESRESEEPRPFVMPDFDAQERAPQPEFVPQSDYEPYPLNSELEEPTFAQEPTPAVFPNFDEAPELPDFSQEREPTIELPDFDRVAAESIAPSETIPLPFFQDPDKITDKPVALSKRKFFRICRAPETRLVFIQTRKRYWFAAVFAECLLCPPCGILAYRSLKRVFERLARVDFRGAARELDATRRRLVVGAAILGVVGFLALLWLASLGDWSEIQWFEIPNALEDMK